MPSEPPTPSPAIGPGPPRAPPSRHNPVLGIRSIRPNSVQLTNADLDSRSPFSCLLVGQPTLRRRIRLGAFAALDQRVALRYSMTGMELTETAGHVAHHLKIAGRSDTLLSDDALALVHQVSRGLPRAVNNLAVQSLVAAFAAKKSIVDESSARAAVTEVTAE